MKILNLLLLLSLFTIISCGDDDSDMNKTETLVDKVKGNHTGLFKNIACSLLQTVNFTDDQSSLNIVETSDSTVSAEFMFSVNNTLNTFNFNGTMSADSTLSVEPFEANNTIYTGNIFLQENGKIKVFMSNGCVIFGNPGVTDIFEED